MPQIALIKFHEENSYYDNYDRLIDSITDWREVTNEELKALNKWCKNYDFRVVERIDTKPEMLIKYVEQALNLIREEEAQEEARKAEQAAKRAKAALKRQNKKEAEEREMLKVLQEKYNATNNS